MCVRDMVLNATFNCIGGVIMDSVLALTRGRVR